MNAPYDRDDAWPPQGRPSGPPGGTPPYDDASGRPGAPGEYAPGEYGDAAAPVGGYGEPAGYPNGGPVGYADPDAYVTPDGYPAYDDPAGRLPAEGGHGPAYDPGYGSGHPGGHPGHHPADPQAQPYGGGYSAYSSHGGYGGAPAPGHVGVEDLPEAEGAGYDYLYREAPPADPYAPYPSGSHDPHDPHQPQDPHQGTPDAAPNGALDDGTRHLGRIDTSTPYPAGDDVVAAAEVFGDPPPAAGAADTGKGAPGGPGAETAQSAGARKGGGRLGGILRSSAVMAAGTLVSRLTGFVRNLVVVAAIGTLLLGDSYQVALNLPTQLYILIGGGALNAVFVPQLVKAMKRDDDGGDAYANRLLTLVMVVTGVGVAAAVVGAPLLVRLMSPELASDPRDFDVTVAFTRYVMPMVFFMGLHVVAGQILNARGRFGAMMWTPVLNNVVIIAAFTAFILVFGPARSSGVTIDNISPEAVRLLGIGTTLGLVVQALAMLPYLRAVGFRVRPRFDWRGHGLGKAARLARWTFLFVLANQAGMVVVTQLATAANANAVEQGITAGAGFAAYTNALLIWQLPQAVITVSVMTAVLPRISRAAADDDTAAVRDDLSYGLRTQAVAIVPAAFAFLALGPWIGMLLFGAGAGAEQGRMIGWMLSAFGLGLIPYTATYVLLRGFYAYEDTRTPFFNTVWVALSNAGLSAVAYFLLPAQWAVTGMAFAYGVAYVVGMVTAARRLRKRVGDLDGARVRRTYVRLVGACLPAAALAFVTARWLESLLGTSVLGAAASFVAGSVVLVAVFVLLAQRMRVDELTSLVGMVRNRLGR
ncbi:murein biosynthesis integral membrane protein MurJ [Allostreptomyces psammosilenae]|uniref:Putative peptidoglycan lipid II flippase n=1 Tax=Allostreptomyces psammosilenae TaxID=1892865 RepID=A0A852ZVY9_9ACTN|nr:murein biosynthesis integral membrane protein MurJ [Allostreptomyces psammosilenae]NYI05420.1 putative peptidoglycan lipid II flippase [Allostreptomyces psammosilenae]